MNELTLAIPVAIPVLFAISLHESAHGYAARHFGDPTAAEAGRLSLNPLRHIDLFGTLLLPLMLYLWIKIPLGYAKPVPVDVERLRHPARQMVWVALAGPAANFGMGLGWTILSALCVWARVSNPFFITMAHAGIGINAAMFVLNLIPIPPLDGASIIAGLLPLRWRERLEKIDSALVFPPRWGRMFAKIDLLAVLAIAALAFLMYMHIIDGLFRTGILFVIKLFALLVSPLTLLLN